MHPILRNVLAVLAGIIVGSIVNMSIVTISGSIIPPPEGADVTTMEGLQASIHLFEPKHFLMPFLAHALGTLVGAFITGLIAIKRKKQLALLIGVFFLAGGIYMSNLVDGPLWFDILDLMVAYIPAAWMGGFIAVRLSKK